MPWLKFAEWLGFQLVWLACALGAANGRSAPGLLAAVVFIGVILAAKRWDRAEILTIIASGAIGSIAESLLVATGLIRYATPWPHSSFVPAWMLALWLAFGATIGTFTTLLGKSAVNTGAVIGFLAGPLVYWAGAKVGAIDLSANSQLAFLVIALIWAFALPTLILLRTVWRQA